MEFIGLGGTDEIGASSYLYLLGEQTLLIDAGIRPGGSGEQMLPNLGILDDLGRTLDAIILTHAHLDHVGALPQVVRRYPKTPVLATAPTVQLLPKILEDVRNVGRSRGEEPFTGAEYHRAVDALHSVRFHAVHQIGDTAVTLLPAGHLMGAASIGIHHRGMSVMHTGDINNVATPTVAPAFRPSRPERQTAVVTESTYGDTLLANRKETTREFVGAVEDVLKRGGRVLIPTFALGRAQDILVLLLEGMLSGTVPEAPIYLDGLVRHTTSTYEELLDHLPTSFRNKFRASKLRPFLRSPVVSVSDADHRARIMASPRRAVILASSGMLHAGASPEYARALLPDPVNGLFLVGYQDEDSPGQRLMNLRRGESIPLRASLDGRMEEVVVGCEVVRYALSGHADRIGLLGHLAAYPSDRVVFTHGSHNARTALASHISKDAEAHLPKAGDVVNLRQGRAAASITHKAFRAPKPPVARIRTFESPVDVSHSPEGEVVLKFKIPPGEEHWPAGLYRAYLIHGTCRVSLKQLQPPPAPAAPESPTAHREAETAKAHRG